jgi:hypothetical protein
LGSDHHEIRLAVARARFDRFGVRHQPPDDHLPVAHVVFLDLRALADAAQLHQRIARVGLVFGAHDVVVIGGGNHADLRPASDRR